MKLLAILVILILFAPIASYGQTDFNTIIIEPATDSTDILVTVEGDLYDEGLVMLYIKGFFGSNSVSNYSQEQTFTENNPTHVFNLDYPFLTNEVYTVTAINGNTMEELEWVPLPVTQQESTSKQETSKNSNTIEKVQLASTLEEPISEQTISDDSDLVQSKKDKKIQSWKDKNKLLREEIEKKDAVIMEQINVIQDLASQIKNAIFSNTIDSMPHLIALEEQTNEQNTSDDSVKSLKKENKLLKKEIKNKNAVMMEQVKVIQDLASQITNANFESTSKYFSLV